MSTETVEAACAEFIETFRAYYDKRDGYENIDAGLASAMVMLRALGVGPSTSGGAFLDTNNLADAFVTLVAQIAHGAPPDVRAQLRKAFDAGMDRVKASSATWNKVQKQ